LIAEEDVAGMIDEDAVRETNFGDVGGDVVPVIAGRAGAGDSDDVAGGSDNFADAVIFSVGKVDVAKGVGVQTGGKRDLRLDGWNVVTVVAGSAGAGDGLYQARRSNDFADDLVSIIRKEDVAVNINV